MGRLCAACCKELPKEEFSVKQWRQKQYQRRCKRCIVENKPLTLKPPPKPSCWICLEEGQHETGTPLRRDCSCRGDAGFVHLPCIVQFAKSKSVDNELMKEQWAQCPNCRQEYGEKLALDMAEEYISFVETELDGDGWAGRWVGNRQEVTPRHLYARVVAHQHKLLLTARINRDIKIERSAHAIIELMRRIKLRGSDYFVNQSARDLVLPPDEFLLDAEAFAHFTLGALYSKDGTKETYDLAIAHYETAKAIHEDLGNDDDVANMATYVADVKSRLEGTYEDEDDNRKEKDRRQLMADALEQGDRERLAELAADKHDEREEKRMKCQRVFEDSYESFGLASATVKDGVYYIDSLRDANHGVEAERLASQLFASSRTLHGAHHDSTKLLKKVRRACQARRVAHLQGKGGGFEIYRALKYDAIEDKCVLRGPISDDDPDGSRCEGTLTIDASELVPEVGSPIFVRGAKGDLSHLNGKIGDVRGCSFDTPCLLWIHFEDQGLEPTLVHRKNVRVVIELPDKEE